MNAQKQFEKETGEKAFLNLKNRSFPTVKYVEWLENKINTSDNSGYEKCQHWKVYNKGGSGEFGRCDCQGNLK
jgi:hypothetical protein